MLYRLAFLVVTTSLIFTASLNAQWSGTVVYAVQTENDFQPKGLDYLPQQVILETNARGHHYPVQPYDDEEKFIKFPSLYI